MCQFATYKLKLFATFVININKYTTKTINYVTTTTRFSRYKDFANAGK